MPGLSGVSSTTHPHHQQLSGEVQSEELKRRTRVVRIFPNREACLRLVSALAVEQSEEWLTGRRYLDMEELREHRRLRDSEAEEVTLMKR